MRPWKRRPMAVAFPLPFFNVLTINARALPGTEPLVARLNQRVRIRLINLSAMEHHPIHLYGYQFAITETDRGTIQEPVRRPEVTALVPVGATRTIEFVEDAPGDWALHCHMTHHVMNQMGHNIPNMIGVDSGELDKTMRRLLPNYMTMGQTGTADMAEMGMKIPKNSVSMVGRPGPFGYITMGGMFSIFKVRDGIESFEDPGWYEYPEGTVAFAASRDDITRDEIDA